MPCNLSKSLIPIKYQSQYWDWYLPCLYHRGTVRLKRQCFKWKLQISMKKVKSRFLSESHVGWAQFDHWWNWHKAYNPEETKWLACVNSSNIISPAIPSGMKEHHLDFSVTASKSPKGSKTGFKGVSLWQAQLTDAVDFRMQMCLFVQRERRWMKGRNKRAYFFCKSFSELATMRTFSPGETKFLGVNMKEKLKERRK